MWQGSKPGITWLGKHRNKSILRLRENVHQVGRILFQKNHIYTTSNVSDIASYVIMKFVLNNILRPNHTPGL